MKKHGSTIILTVIFLIGLAVLLYPSVSNYVNSINASRAIVNYDETASRITREKYETMLEQAKEYNKQLAQKSTSFKNGEPADSYYRSLLDITGDGMMGYISVRKLGINLPLYHGTSEHALSFGAGHLEGSSLPVGGTSTHAIITGHRGLPSARLFTDLDRIEIGDNFALTVLNENLNYIIDKISIVEPDDIEQIEIIPDEEYTTLITCTPYAVNTQRLLVRGKKTDSLYNIRVAADAIRIDPLVAAPIIAAPITAVFLISYPLLPTGKRKSKAYKNWYYAHRKEENI